MSEDVRAEQGDSGVKQGIAAGTSIGAAVILVTLGIISFFQGIAAVAEDEVFVRGIEYVYKLDFTSWGWIHIVLGVLMVIVGIALMAGQTWARVSAVIIAALSIIANFLWLPYYPWWSILIIIINVVVIWAVATWRPHNV